MSNIEKLASQNAPEINNVGTAPTSNELLNNQKNMTIEENLNDKADAPQFKTVQAIINGEMTNIILARHKYSMEGLKASQVKQLEMIDKSKMLNVIYHVSTAEIFYNAEITLFDYNGNEIPVGTQDVFVPVETADTFYRYAIDDILKTVEVHTFNNVQEFAEVTGTTTLFSRGLTSKEKIGVAALATNDEVCNAVYDLAVETNMPASTAQLYLDVQIKGVTAAMMATGYISKDMCGLGRTMQEAKQLHLKTSLTFGVNEAKKRYAIRAINYLQKVEGFSLEQIFDALDTIPAHGVEKAKLMKCGDKETCIVTVLMMWMREGKANRQHKPAA